jgi:hypothetical protein
MVDSTALFVDEAARRRSGICVFVPIMVPHPVAQVEIRSGLVAALGRQIKADVGADYFFAATAVGRIGVKDLTGRVFIENAETRHFFAFDVSHFVVVVSLTLGDFLFGVRNLIIVVELAAPEETQGIRQPMRCLKASISGRVARETATHVTS